MKPRRPFLDHKSAFLEAFGETGSVVRAADIVGVRRGMHYRWLKDDPSYLDRFLQLNVRANSNHSYEARKKDGEFGRSLTSLMAPATSSSSRSQNS